MNEEDPDDRELELAATLAALLVGGFIVGPLLVCFLQWWLNFLGMAS